jgi:hypothetical protein
VAHRLGLVRRTLARRDVTVSLLMLIAAAAALGLVLAFRGGEEDDGALERARAAEAEARGALEEIDRRLAARPGEELEAYEALRALYSRYPATEAGLEAMRRVQAVRSRLEGLRKARFDDAMARAREHAAAREYDRAIAILETQGPVLRATEWGPRLELEIGRITGLARETLRELEKRVQVLLVAGKLEEALRVLDAAPHERAGGLAEWIDLQREHVRLGLER